MTKQEQIEQLLDKMTAQALMPEPALIRAGNYARMVGFLMTIIQDLDLTDGQADFVIERLHKETNNRYFFRA